MEEYTSFNVVSGYSNVIDLNYPGYFIFDVTANHWGTGGVTLERSPVYQERFSVVEDEDGALNFSTNGSRFIPGVGSYRVNCSGYSTMSGVEALLTPFRYR